MLSGPVHSDYGDYGVRIKRLPWEGYVSVLNFALHHRRKGLGDALDKRVYVPDFHE